MNMEVKTEPNGVELPRSSSPNHSIVSTDIKPRMGPPRGRGGFRGNRGRDRGPRSRNDMQPQGFNPDQSIVSTSRSSFSSDPRNEEDQLAKIGGHTLELQPNTQEEKKFLEKARLYVGNVPNDVTQDEFEKLFSEFGEVSDLFINKAKMFAFLRMDYRTNAEKARRALDGFTFQNRQLRVRFAPYSNTIKCQNLNPFVTNELLMLAFRIFGEVERAIVVADQRGKSTGEGIVEFKRKSAAQRAITRCNEDCYFLTKSPIPVIVSLLDNVDDSEGFSEKSVFRKGDDFLNERRRGPRIPERDSFEAEYGLRWKRLLEQHEQNKKKVDDDFEQEKEQLKAQLQFVMYNNETEQLRKQLRMREEALERQKNEWQQVSRSFDDRQRMNSEMPERPNFHLNSQEENSRKRHFYSTPNTGHGISLTDLDDLEQNSLFERREPREGGMAGSTSSLNSERIMSQVYVAADNASTSRDNTTPRADAADVEMSVGETPPQQPEQGKKNNNNKRRPRGGRWVKYRKIRSSIQNYRMSRQVTQEALGLLARIVHQISKQ